MATGGSDDEKLLLGDEDYDPISQQPQMQQFPSPSYPPQGLAYPPPPVGVVPMGMMSPGPGPVTHQVQGQASGTTVIINQHMAPQPVRMPRDWSSGKMDCCDDMGSCLLGTFCPLILSCQIAGEMNESMCVPCCVPGWLIVLRAKLRAENGIEGSVMGDCCDVCCCGHCVLCQMSRELKFIRNSY